MVCAGAVGAVWQSRSSFRHAEVSRVIQHVGQRAAAPNVAGRTCPSTRVIDGKRDSHRHAFGSPGVAVHKKLGMTLGMTKASLRHLPIKAPRLVDAPRHRAEKPPGPRRRAEKPPRPRRRPAREAAPTEKPRDRTTAWAASVPSLTEGPAGSSQMCSTTSENLGSLKADCSGRLPPSPAVMAAACAAVRPGVCV